MVVLHKVIALLLPAVLLAAVYAAVPLNLPPGQWVFVQLTVGDTGLHDLFPGRNIHLSTQKNIHPPTRLAMAAAHQYPKYQKQPVITASIGVLSCHLIRYSRNLFMAPIR